LKELLKQYTERFPKNYDLQLKGLAEQFETIFNHADPKKQLDQDKPYLQSLGKITFEILSNSTQIFHTPFYQKTW
jgi:hypothetical protein